ncbi:Thrombospondin Type-1 Domain-Containing Protein 7A [Manis pentadactyla]|nr:Thrombospondin Type-1 Domain-Containing Protein 7A [Manis pentadactyla]
MGDASPCVSSLKMLEHVSWLGNNRTIGEGKRKGKDKKEGKAKPKGDQVQCAQPSWRVSKTPCHKTCGLHQFLAICQDAKNKASAIRNLKDELFNGQQRSRDEAAQYPEQGWHPINKCFLKEDGGGFADCRDSGIDAPPTTESEGVSARGPFTSAYRSPARHRKLSGDAEEEVQEKEQGLKLPGIDETEEI